MNRNPVLPSLTLPTEPKALRSIDLMVSQTYTGHGFLALDALPRVALEAATRSPDDGFDWAVETFFDGIVGGEPRLKMNLNLKGQMHLICQRCMQPCLVEVEESPQFVFLANEALADAFPMEDDALEPLVMDSQFDLLGTIEDEILLSLPLIPKHPEGACEPAALRSGADDSMNQDETTKKPDNPFNILKNMKKKE
ncbi:YceD family protein [Polynucleobacter difficilis]|uniref:YceD family protein n=1 Tax=Polynucleobacter difficilis TaxID=556054 RepID=UPI000D343881|nr:YceD family protein [Polynucleobacter difficilis]